MDVNDIDEARRRRMRAKEESDDMAVARFEENWRRVDSLNFPSDRDMG